MHCISSFKAISQHNTVGIAGSGLVSPLCAHMFACVRVPCVCVSRSKPGVTETDDCVKVVSPQGFPEWFSRPSFSLLALARPAPFIVMTSCRFRISAGAHPSTSGCGWTGKTLRGLPAIYCGDVCTRALSLSATCAFCEQVCVCVFFYPPSLWVKLKFPTRRLSRKNTHLPHFLNQAGYECWRTNVVMSLCALLQLCPMRESNPNSLKVRITPRTPPIPCPQQTLCLPSPAHFCSHKHREKVRGGKRHW